MVRFGFRAASSLISVEWRLLFHFFCPRFQSKVVRAVW